MVSIFCLNVLVLRTLFEGLNLEDFFLYRRTGDVPF